MSKFTEWDVKVVKESLRSINDYISFIQQEYDYLIHERKHVEKQYWYAVKKHFKTVDNWLIKLENIDKRLSEEQFKDDFLDTVVDCFNSGKYKRYVYKNHTSAKLTEWKIFYVIDPDGEMLGRPYVFVVNNHTTCNYAHLQPYSGNVDDYYKDDFYDKNDTSQHYHRWYGTIYSGLRHFY